MFLRGCFRVSFFASFYTLIILRNRTLPEQQVALSDSYLGSISTICIYFVLFKILKRRKTSSLMNDQLLIDELNELK